MKNEPSCGRCGKPAVQRVVESTKDGRPIAIRFNCPSHKVRGNKSTRRAFDLPTNERGK